MFAKQTGFFIIGKAVIGIHVEVVFAEEEHELPHGAVYILRNRLIVLIATFNQALNIRPEEVP